MDINEIYQSKSNYLRATDLKGSRVEVEIESYSVETMKSDEGDKPQVVLRFVGKEKQLGLNKTNANRIAILAKSTNPDNWIGAKIKIFPTMTDFGGKQVECIRVSEEHWVPPVRPHAAAVAAQAPMGGASLDAEEIPF